MNALPWELLRNRWAAFLHDLLWVPVAVLLAYWFATMPTSQ